MRQLVILLLCAFVLATPSNALAQPMEIEAMLILASDEPAPLDRRLERVDYILRPLLRFETYRWLGQGSALVNTPGTATIALGDGHSLQLRTGRSRGSHVEVTWMRGNERLISTSVSLQRGKPTILGGVPHVDGRLIVTLMVK
jgi:hypothetical protein